MAPAEERCEVVIYRGQTGTSQTFPLSSGGVLRVGRCMASDVVLDFNGVTVYHCEIYLRHSSDPNQANKHVLCVRDTSKNGTGIRPGPYGVNAEEADPYAWEPLKRDGLRVLENGWQLMVPLRSRKDNLQLPEAWRTLTIFVGSKSSSMVGAVGVDGEIWKPESGKLPKLGLGFPLPPPGGFAFAEAPPPTKGRLAAKDAGQKRMLEDPKEDLESDDDRLVRKRVKKDKKGKRRDGHASGSDDEVGKKEKKRDKKARKKVDEQDDTDDDEEIEKRDRKKDKKDRKTKRRGEKDDRHQPVDRQPVDRKKKDREERQRLERELEVELAEELNMPKKARSGRDNGDEVSSVNTRRATTRQLDDSDPDDDDLVSAWSRALAPQDARVDKPPANVQASDMYSSKLTSHSATAFPIGLANQTPAVVEVSKSASGDGIYLRCGTHGGHPQYRRLLAETKPVMLYYWDGLSEQSRAGWYIADNFDKQGQDNYKEFWRSAPTLPASGAGECGGTMGVRGQLDGPALAALGKLPEDLRTSVRASFTAAISGGKVVNEEDDRETVADAISTAALAPPSPPPMSDVSTLPPWKRRGLRSGLAQIQESQDTRKDDKDAPRDVSPAAGEATDPAADSVAPMSETTQGVVEPETVPLSGGATADAGTAQETAAETAEGAAGDEAQMPEPRVEPTSDTVDAAAQGSKDASATAEPASEPVLDEKKVDATAAAEATGDAEAQDAVGATVAADAAMPSQDAAENSATDVTNEGKVATVTHASGTEPAGPDGQAAEATTTENEIQQKQGEGISQPEDDRESVRSRPSLTTTAPQKTVPGDRGGSVAPTIPPELRADSEHVVETAEPAVKGRRGLTTEALAAHTAALARAQAEAYAATYAQARSHYSKSAAGKSAAGRTVAGMSIAGRSIAGRSVAGRSIAGRSIAASGVAPSERTFRTHMTTRELLVGGSEMREIMRSVSPISTPGVEVKRRGKRKPSLTREMTPLISASRTSISRERKKKKKKEKKEKKLRLGKLNKKQVARPATMTLSPSHYQPISPTPLRLVSGAATSTTPGDRPPRSRDEVSDPARWQEPSETPEPLSMAIPRAAKPKRMARRDLSSGSDDARHERRKKSIQLKPRGMEGSKRRR